MLLTIGDDSEDINLEFFTSPEDKENQRISKIYSKENESMLYLLLKYGVSMNFYHELSMIFKELPRIHMVRVYIIVQSKYIYPGAYEPPKAGLLSS